MKLSVVNTETTKKKRKNKQDVSQIHLFCRDENKERKIVSLCDFHPYFYLENPHDKALEEAKDYKYMKTDTLKGNREVYYLEYFDKGLVNKYRKFGDTHYEADVLFPDRFKIDKKITSGIEVEGLNSETEWENISKDDMEPIDFYVNPRYCFLDIEVVSPSTKFPVPEDAEFPICLITMYDSYSEDVLMLTTKEVDIGEDNCTVVLCKDEIHLLKIFIKTIQRKDPDIFLGWNVSGFDLTYLINRMRKNDINYRELSPLGVVEEYRNPVNIKGRDVLELRDCYLKLSTSDLRSYSLEHVAKEEELKTKPIPIEDFQYVWSEIPKKLAKHNYADVINMVELDEKLDLIEFFEEMSRITGLDMSDTLYNSKIVDMTFLRRAKEKDMLLPSRGQHENVAYEGAKVVDPSVGIHDNVVVIDFSSFYPNTLLSFNISPDTKIDDKFEAKTIENKTNVINLPKAGKISFSLEKEGFLTEVTKDMIETRSNKKQLMKNAESDEVFDKYYKQQWVYKTIANSIYGTLGYERFRLYDWKIAQTITYLAKDILLNLIKKLEQLGYEVVYGDTDSCAVKVDDLDKIDELEKVSNDLTKRYIDRKYNVTTDRIKLEAEKVYDKLMLFDAKKKYAGLVRKADKSRDKYDFTGLISGPRSTGSNFAETVQRRLLKLVLNEKPNKTIKRMVKDKIRMYREGKVPYEDMGVPTKIKRDPRLDDHKKKEMYEQGQVDLLAFEEKKEHNKDELINWVDKVDGEPDGYHHHTMIKQAWKRTKKLLGIEFRQFQKPMRIYTDKGLVLFTNENQLHTVTIDYEKNLEKSVRNKIENILNMVGIKWDEVVPPQYTKLDDFS